MPAKPTAPYGSWPSPISPTALATSGVGLASPAIDTDPTTGQRVTYWLEGRPNEGGRLVPVALRDGERSDVLGPGWNVRTRVHEYGGGSYLIRAGVLWFVEFSDQRLYRRDPGGEPYPITPEPDRPGALRYADFARHPDGRLFCVHEQHAADGTVHNAIAQLDDAGGGAMPRLIDTDHDFVSSPRISPDGTRLAWLAWNHPRMPWDGTVLRTGRITADTVVDVTTLAGGPTESLVQPEWAPDGRLTVCSDRTDWWNLYAVDIPSGELAPLAPLDAEVGHPAWQFGMRSYAWLPDGRAVLVIDRSGRTEFAVLAPDHSIQDVPAGVWPTRAFAVDDESVVAVVNRADTPTSLVRIDLTDAATTPLRVSTELHVGLEPGDISHPEAIAFPTTGGATAYANYYPPANAQVTGPADERAPLLVRSHGGPTSQSPALFDISIQAWTSRGFGVVDVNYGGSTGYGRAYRQRLSGQWGIVDVDDCVAAARYLVERGDADPERLAIYGGSAGGWTTLCALTFTDVFAAGASLFGVSDASLLAKDTHKFESRYLDGLIAPWPDGADVYAERSPLNHTDQLSTPMILLQGLEDVIVPPAQAEAMVEALRNRNVPHAYLAFEGEQHGFRQASTIIAAFEAMLSFYGQIFGFEPAGDITPVVLRGGDPR